MNNADENISPGGAGGEAGRPAAFAWSLGALGFVSLAGLAFNIVLARALTVGEFGHVRLIRTVLELAAIPASAGMAACVAKHAADARVRPAERARILGTALTLSLGGSSLATLAVFGLLAIPGILNDAVAQRFARWMIFLLPFLSLYACMIGYLQGTGQIRRLALTQIARSLMLLTLGSGLILTLGFRGWAAGRASTEILAAGFALTAAAAMRPWRLDRARAAPFIRFGLYAALTQGMTALVSGIDILCLDRFRADPVELGQYGIATLVFATAHLIPIAFVQATFSRMAAHAYDPRRTWSALGHYTLRLAGLVVPAAAVAFFAAPVIRLIFGEGYAPSVRFFQWLTPAFAIHGVSYAATNLLVGAGLMRQKLFIALGTAGLNLALNVALIPLLGVAGAVMATTGSFLFQGAASVWVLKRYRDEERIRK